MKTTSTEAEIKAILGTLSRMDIFPFRHQSGDIKRNAQLNLEGKTHYVDDATLRWHHSRICAAGHLHGGLLFRIVTSDALDMRNTKRGYRAIVHDLFGTAVYAPDLEQATATKQAALNALEKESIDLVAHYRQAIDRARQQLQDSADKHASALITLDKLRQVPA